VNVLRRLFGSGVPDGFPGRLDAEESVAAVAELAGGGHLVATSLGLWVPDDDGVRRIGWHLISKATWRENTMVVTEARETDTAGEAVLISDLPPRRYPVSAPGRLPKAVHVRVTGSIRSRDHRELPGGGAWFVQRKVPGRDGVVLQVRPDEGTDPEAVARVAAEVAGRIREALQ
jgi:hypothetical protein